MEIPKTIKPGNTQILPEKVRQFNFNMDVYVHILDKGWEKLIQDRGRAYVAKQIDAEGRRYLINGVLYHRMRAADVVKYFSVSGGCGDEQFLYTVLIPKKDLHKHEGRDGYSYLYD